MEEVTIGLDVSFDWHIRVKRLIIELKIPFFLIDYRRSRVYANIFQSSRYNCCV